MSRRGWRAEGPEARERESSSEPRPDAEANARRNGTGSPRASQAVASTRRTQRDNATKRSVPVAIEAGFSRRAGHRGPAAYGAAGVVPGLFFAPSGPSWPGGLGGRPASCRPGRCGPHRPTGARRLRGAAGVVPGLFFAPSGPSWPGGLGSGRRRAGRAGCSATGLRRCGPHRPTGAARAYWGRTGVLGSHGRTGVR